MVDDHIRFEERVLFPHLEQLLSDLQLEAIGEKLNNSGPPELNEAYPDQFWA
jgi:hemerythrin-like domain-containing protein